MNPHRKYFLLNAVLIACVFLSACGGQATAQPATPQTAALSEVQGSVEIFNPGETDFAPATEGMTLQEGGQVRTGEDGRVRLDLSSGTLIRLAPNTAFLLEANAETEDGLSTRLQLLFGQIWVVLNGGNLDVETPSGVAAVRGSYLSIRIDPLTLDVWVGCYEGECSAENASGLLELITGQGAILYYVVTDGTPPPPGGFLLTWDDFLELAANVPEAADILQDIIATLTAMPSEPPVPTATPTPTPTPAEAGSASSCTLSLLAPANGSELPATGEINFTWTSQADAASYLVTITSAGGAINLFPTPGTSLARYVESFPIAGTYSWQVSALDSDGQPICSAGPFSFSKPQSYVEPPYVPPAYTGLGNAVFNLIQGPIDYPFFECYQPYEVAVSDPDGVSQVTVNYQVFDFYGSPYSSGSINLAYDTQSASWQGEVNPYSIEGDTVSWWFVARDGLGNLESSTTYSYIENTFCVPPPIDNPTTFNIIQGPTGTPPGMCTQTYEVNVVDLDGVSDVTLYYQIENPPGTVITIGTPIPLTYGAGTWTTSLNPLAFLGDTVVWWLMATDGLSNVTASAAYSYVENYSTCAP